MARKTILIVEDDKDIRANLQELYEAEGYSVLLAPHGQAALDFLDQETSKNLGLILLDLMMPVMDGPQFLVELERNHPHVFGNIPIFILTAKGGAGPHTLKTTGLLEKPLKLRDLCRVAEQYCDL